MDEVLHRLKQGIRRFQTEIYPARAEQYERVMNEPQRPHTLIITCADSRLQPDVLTQADPGEIFVSRNIGNMVPIYGETSGGVDAVLEYAVAALGVQHIAICGHTNCGAMKALLEPGSAEAMPSVSAWLGHAQAALAAAHALASPEDDLLRVITEQNVLLQMSHLRTYPVVADALAKGKVHLSGWVYDISAGQVSLCYDGSTAFHGV